MPPHMAADANATPAPGDHADLGGVRERGEYELELEEWFRSRFRWLCLAYALYECLSILVLALRIAVSGEGTAPDPAFPLEGTAGAAATDLGRHLYALVGTVVTLGILSRFLLVDAKRIDTRGVAVATATRLILWLGGVNLAWNVGLHWADPEATNSPLQALMFWHLTACLFLPWSPRESLRPMAWLLGAWAIYHLVLAVASRGLDGLPVGILGVLVAPLVLLPGVLIAWQRLSRHRRQFRRAVTNRFFQAMRREIEQARTLHESLFPRPFSSPGFAFDYRYRPAQEIGGDFVHAWTDGRGTLHVALLDVTGHGLASAMTVNRLYGELERIRFEHPYLRPGQVLGLLNRYVLLTLAPHGIHASAIYLRLDPRNGELTCANAGHPPVFLRSADGRVRDLDSTEPILGVLPPGDFGVGELSIRLAAGDSLLLYTDGAFESRDRQGRKLGLERLRDALRREGGNAELFLTLVDNHARGVIDDDILVATVRFAGPTDPEPAMEPATETETAGATA
jgi:serine phosphatase RsbU (regulator of sigma subunit)